LLIANSFTRKGFTMNRTILISTLCSVLLLAACERQPTVVNVPPSTVAVPVPVPGPAGPQGAPGNPGMDGSKGEPGKPGDSTTIVVTPRPAQPSN
jgi:hypothetical protein